MLQEHHTYLLRRAKQTIVDYNHFHQSEIGHTLVQVCTHKSQRIHPWYVRQAWRYYKNFTLRIALWEQASPHLQHALHLRGLNVGQCSVWFMSYYSVKVSNYYLVPVKIPESISLFISGISTDLPFRPKSSERLNFMAAYELLRPLYAFDRYGARAERLWVSIQ